MPMNTNTHGPRCVLLRGGTARKIYDCFNISFSTKQFARAHCSNRCNRFFFSCVCVAVPPTCTKSRESPRRSLISCHTRISEYHKLFRNSTNVLRNHHCECSREKKPKTPISSTGACFLQLCQIDKSTSLALSSHDNYNRVYRQPEEGVFTSSPSHGGSAIRDRYLSTFTVM